MFTVLCGRLGVWEQELKIKEKNVICWKRKL